MGHPLIDEFCRANQFRPDFLRRCQRIFRDEINPQLDEVARLRQENTDLKAQLAKTKRKATEAA